MQFEMQFAMQFDAKFDVQIGMHNIELCIRILPCSFASLFLCINETKTQVRTKCK